MANGIGLDDLPTMKSNNGIPNMGSEEHNMQDLDLYCRDGLLKMCYG
jgi:hypothetical protein